MFKFSFVKINPIWPFGSYLNDELRFSLAQIESFFNHFHSYLIFRINLFVVLVVLIFELSEFWFGLKSNYST